MTKPSRSYTVQQVASLSGVSVRTLHHYDDIGLLSPSRRENGYRSYGRKDLERLQYILMYRELDVPLESIAKLLAQTNAERKQALHAYRAQLLERQQKLTHLLSTIDAMIQGTPMDDDRLFEAFWEKHTTEYAVEAKERWGNTDAYRQSQERTRHLTKEDHRKLVAKNDAHMRELAARISSGPKNDQVQQLIAQHYESLRAYYDPTPEIYRGLAQMYVDDPRFRAFFERYDAAMPAFMRDAMLQFCSTLE